MSSRAWRERDHPRWPRGSGDKSGEFRDASARSVVEKIYQTGRGGRVTQAEAARIMHGDDWAAKAGGRVQPAGRYGSISTGQTSQCPRCGRTVKIVGTTGKQSTHNAARGRRCPGSGEVVESSQVTDVITRRQTPPKKNRQIKAPPPPPEVVIGRPQETVDSSPAAAVRMDAWQRSTSVQTWEKQTPTKRQRYLAAVERELAADQISLERARNRARNRISLEMDDAGYNPNRASDREDYGYDDEVERDLNVRRFREYIETANEKLAELRSEGPVRFYPDADEPDPYYSRGVLKEPVDPANPLAAYGDMLHIDDRSWHVYQALDSLEQRVPPVLHQIVADYLAAEKISSGSRATGEGSPRVGMWLSATKLVPDLDDLGRLRNEKPRGWHKGAKWGEVDGALSSGHTMAVSYTSNTESKRSARVDRARGTPRQGQPVDASATLHEFGHLLDHALGDHALGKRPARGGADASARRTWRMLYGRVVSTAGTFLSPYFKQKGNAGPQEFFADAFGTWAEVDNGPALRPDGTPLFHFYYDKKGDLVKMPVTWRQMHIAAAYDISYDVAQEVDDYFTKLVASASKKLGIPGER